jgi:hypothetical protein
MPKCLEGRFALGGLAIFAVWTFVFLPFLHSPPSKTQPESISGVSGFFALFSNSGNDAISTYCATDSNKEKAADWKHKYICEVRMTDAYVALFTFVLAFFTLLLILSGVLVGWRTIRRMKITERRQLRAYICEDGLSVTLIPASDNELRFHAIVGLKNFGQTPATDFRGWIKMKILDASMSPFDETVEGFGKRIIAPQGGEANFPVDSAKSYSQNDLNVIRNELIQQTKRIFVWGRADYSDVFGYENLFLKFYYWNGPEEFDSNAVISWPLISADRPHEAN